MEYAALISSVISLIGMFVSSGQNDQALALYKDAVNAYGPDIIPHLQNAMPPQIQSALAGADSSFRQTQGQVIGDLQNEYQTGGNTPADQAAMQLAYNSTGARAASDYQSVAQMMARRGGNNSGLEAALYSQSGQDAANSIGQQSMTAQVAARQRALQALEAAGTQAGTARGQDYDRAAALDRVRLFNAQLQNQAQMYNLQLPQQEFENRMTMLGAQGRANSQLAGAYQQQAGATNQMAGGIANSVLTYGAAADKKNKDGS